MRGQRLERGTLGPVTDQQQDGLRVASPDCGERRDQAIQALGGPLHGHHRDHWRGVWNFQFPADVTLRLGRFLVEAAKVDAVVHRDRGLGTQAAHGEVVGPGALGNGDHAGAPAAEHERLRLETQPRARTGGGTLDGVQRRHTGDASAPGRQRAEHVGELQVRVHDVGGRPGDRAAHLPVGAGLTQRRDAEVRHRDAERLERLAQRIAGFRLQDRHAHLDLAPQKLTTGFVQHQFGAAHGERVDEIQHPQARARHCYPEKRRAHGVPAHRRFRSARLAMAPNHLRARRSSRRAATSCPPPAPRPMITRKDAGTG